MDQPRAFRDEERKDASPGSAGSHTTLSLPTLSLPKGGGALRGIGEKFGANPATGTGSMSVPLATSPGRSGFGPQLSLSYDSGSGNGPFGFGWSLSTPAITRRTDKTCATEAIFAETGRKYDLPLNQPVRIDLTGVSPGTVHYACGMDMEHGTVRIE